MLKCLFIFMLVYCFVGATAASLRGSFQFVLSTSKKLLSFKKKKKKKKAKRPRRHRSRF